MSPTLTSQGIVLATATAMAVSAGTVVLFDLLREKYFPHIPRNHQMKQQPLKSCLSSAGGKKAEAKKKKKVKFADDVKETKGNGEVYRKQGRNSNEIQKNSCGNEINLGCQKMPANHMALYSGILKNRVQRLGCSY
ncbi:hypothetical protein C2S52_001118 [Perilla frutescens var. hirtella]|nr:hypothetical protein C2S51_007355 [Perilla frutescens var. frutescens]KAH6800654.1 hypothetical protein C2S52_001118 [Perilla frutescens var. hirtella]